MPQGSRLPYQREAPSPVEDSSHTLLGYIAAEAEPSWASVPSPVVRPQAVRRSASEPVAVMVQELTAEPSSELPLLALPRATPPVEEEGASALS
eukprot:5186915-Pyramimonas_sp.AAC.1